MTKLDKLRKEYQKTMLDCILEEGTPEMHRALQEKAQRLMNEIQDERMRVAKERGKMNTVKRLINEKYDVIVLMKEVKKGNYTGKKTELSKEQVLERYQNNRAELYLDEHIIGYDDEKGTIMQYTRELRIYI